MGISLARRSQRRVEREGRPVRRSRPSARARRHAGAIAQGRRETTCRVGARRRDAGSAAWSQGPLADAFSRRAPPRPGGLQEINAAMGVIVAARPGGAEYGRRYSRDWPTRKRSAREDRDALATAGLSARSWPSARRCPGGGGVRPRTAPRRGWSAGGQGNARGTPRGRSRVALARKERSVSCATARGRVELP